REPETAHRAGVQGTWRSGLSSHTAGDLPRWCEGLRETRQTELPVWVQQAPALEGQKSDEGCGLRAEQQVHRELDAVSGPDMAQTRQAVPRPTIERVHQHADPAGGLLDAARTRPRSEERRVGKEGRA